MRFTEDEKRSIDAINAQLRKLRGASDDNIADYENYNEIELEQMSKLLRMRYEQ